MKWHCSCSSCNQPFSKYNVNHFINNEMLKFSRFVKIAFTFKSAVKGEGSNVTTLGECRRIGKLFITKLPINQFTGRKLWWRLLLENSHLHQKQWDSRQQLDDLKTKAPLISPGVLSHRIRIKSDSVHVMKGFVCWESFNLISSARGEFILKMKVPAALETAAKSVNN